MGIPFWATVEKTVFKIPSRLKHISSMEISNTIVFGYITTLLNRNHK